jgi:hypothetical protein
MKACRIFAGLGYCAALLLASSGTARAADNTIAVLGIEAADGAPDSVATALTDALRQRASSERGTRLVPGKDLIEVKLIFSCPDEAPSCMAEAAKSLGAGKLIFGSVKKSLGDSYVVTLKLLDVTRKQIDNWVAEPISRAQATPGVIRGPVQKWFAQLTGQSAMGTIRIKGDVPGTAVALDGAPVGVVGSDDLVLANIPAGRREILASKPGYPPVRREVNVTAGNTSEVSIEMTAMPSNTSTSLIPSPVSPTVSGAGTDDPTSLRASSGRGDDDRAGVRLASWGTAAASAVAFGFAIKFAVDVRYYDRKLDVYRRFPCFGNPMDVNCMKDGVTRDFVLEKRHTDHVEELKKEGDRFENLQWIAIGTGSVFAIASGILFYFGYVSDETGTIAGDSGGDWKLQLQPMATTGKGALGGMQARFSF